MATLKQLKSLLKKAGLKSSGSKRALTRRAKKAHLLRGGQDPTPPKPQESQQLDADRKAAGEEAERVMATGVFATPGGVRRSKKRSTQKKRPLRHLTAAAYRW